MPAAHRLYKKKPWEFQGFGLSWPKNGQLLGWLAGAARHTLLRGLLRVYIPL